MRLRDVGWVWEGQAIDPGVPPSIFGAGEGAAYFGLSRATFIFHPNTALAMRKMAHLDEVVCDITKWEYEHVGERGDAARNVLRGDLAVTRAEAEKVSRLSQQFPNISGAYIDDMDTLIDKHGYSPDAHARTYEVLKGHNPYLRLWAVVYTHHMEPDYWAPYAGHIDVVNLWVWHAKDLTGLDEDVARCREVFADQPIVLGCYLRDYPSGSGVPLERLEFQFSRIVRYLEEGRIAGYNILAACLIDTQPEQAEWVRDFIAAH